MINGKTNKVGIIGWPTEHSHSPLIQNTAFKELGMDWVYVPLPVVPEQLGAAVAGLKALGFAGANVTIPHKVSIMPYLDEIDASARLMGAVNTIVIRENKSYGYNTDAEGFIQSLLNKNMNPRGKNAVLFGAGGAARAVVRGLINHDVRHITIVARNTDKAVEFTKLFTDASFLSVSKWEGEAFSQALANSDLLINCTSVGMSPNIQQEIYVDWASITKKATVCDLVYNPRATKLIRTAQQLGHDTVTGEGMLVEQGALSFALWTGRTAPKEMMYRAMQEVLSNP